MPGEKDRRIVSLGSAMPLGVGHACPVPELSSWGIEGFMAFWFAPYVGVCVVASWLSSLRERNGKKPQNLL